MKKKYYLDGEKLVWFKNNYNLLGGMECSTILSLPVKFLHKMASKNGLRVGDKILSKEQSNRILKYFNNKRKEDKIKTKNITINSPEKAYTLGFLWGDGYLQYHGKNKTCCYPNFAIVKEDFDDILKHFTCWGNWSIYYAKEKKGHRAQGQATLCNQVMGWFLEENDYKNKSIISPNKILSCIPENLRHYWWRGYSDADGCFYINIENYLRQYSIAGSYEQDWTEAEKLFQELEISKYQVNRRTHEGNTNFKDARDSVIRFSNKDSIIKFGNYIYQDRLDIGLKRKYIKYLQIKNS